MLKHYKLLVAAVSLTVLSFAVSASENPLLVSGHPDYPPFMWQEGETIVGVGADIVKIALDELNIPSSNEYTGPWKRVQKNARHGRVDLIVGIYSNDERRTYLDYTIPYALDPTSVFSWKGKKFAYSGWDDLKGKRGTTMLGDSFGQKLDQYIKENLKLERVFKVHENFERLQQGRADYFIYGYYPGLIWAGKLGYGDKIDVVAESVVDEGMYIAISKKSPYRHLVPEINRIIKRLKQDGTIKRLIDKHMKAISPTK